MNNVLAQMLQGILIVPLEKSVIENLCNHCRDYAVSLNDDSFCDLVSDLLLEKNQSDLCNKLQAIYNSNNDDKIVIPECASIALGFFIVYFLIVASDTSTIQKNKYSASLMNLMILCKGRFQELPYKEFITQLYGFFDKELQKNNNDEFDLDSDVLDKMLNDAQIFNEEAFEESELIELRAIAHDASIFQLRKILKDQSLMSGKNIYIKVYYIINKYVKRLPTLYLNYSITDILSDIKKGQGVKDKKLSDIIKIISDDPDFIEPTYQSKSAILLRLLNKDNAFNNISILGEPFSVEEFSVYLYYELIFDKYLNQIKSNETE